MESESSEPDLRAARLWSRGRRFHEFTIGDVYRHHWGRTLTEADALLFATQTLAWSPLYLNVEYARGRGHPDVAVSPYLVLSVVVGLSVEDLSEHSEAFLGLDAVEFHEPVYPGDTITAISCVQAKRRSRSNPENGIVTWATEGQNQHRRPVVGFRRTNLFRMEASDAPG